MLVQLKVTNASEPKLLQNVICFFPRKLRIIRIVRVERVPSLFCYQIASRSELPSSGINISVSLMFRSIEHDLLPDAIAVVCCREAVDLNFHRREEDLS